MNNLGRYPGRRSLEEGGEGESITLSITQVIYNPCLDGLSEGLSKAWELYEQPR